MTRHRGGILFLLLALIAMLALAAAGCGGDDDDEAGGTGDTGASTAAENVSGSVTILADWTGAEGKSFQAVLDKFKEKYPNVNATYRPSTNLTQDLSTAVEGGNPPDLAAIPSPGIMRDYQKRGSLKPIDFAKDTMSANYAKDWVDLGTVNGKLYGMIFKGANKSTVWYNKHTFEDAGVDPPSTWEELLTAADTVKASGVPPFAFGAAEGWTLTDVFENLYAFTAGADKYRQLVTHDIPWTDPTVKKALTEFGKILKDPKNLNGGTAGALQTQFATAVTQVLAETPKAAMIMEGDFVPGVAKGQTQAQAGTDFDFFDFPTFPDSEDVVVSGGNLVIMFQDSPAAQALVEWLATPEAAEVWAGRGGFSSPNKNVDESVYPDYISKRAATTLANSPSALFDLSDQAPGAFGSGDMWTILQGFVRNPDDVDGTAQKLEAAAAKAYTS
jgi:alpha-glucoside transport system substrate-binding protein